jgi:PP-loop superfamily ATP-utilizing enzyme
MQERRKRITIRVTKGEIKHGIIPTQLIREAYLKWHEHVQTCDVCKQAVVIAIDRPIEQQRVDFWILGFRACLDAIITENMDDDFRPSEN